MGFNLKKEGSRFSPLAVDTLRVRSCICIALDLHTKVDDLDIEFVLCIAFL